MNDINELIENMREAERGIMALKRVPLTHSSGELTDLKSALDDLFYETAGLLENVNEALEASDD